MRKFFILAVFSVFFSCSGDNFGACINNYMGGCTDNVLAFFCSEDHLSFRAGEKCDIVDPLGACTLETGVCTNSVRTSVCMSGDVNATLRVGIDCP